MTTLVDGVTYLITGIASGADGLFHGDTRHLLPLSISVEGITLDQISATHDPPSSRRQRLANVGTTVNEISESVVSKHATVIVDRRQSITEGRLSDQFRLYNHCDHERQFDVTIEFRADFADIFEVRKMHEVAERDVSQSTEDETVVFSYAYQDANDERRTLETLVGFDKSPAALRPNTATFRPSLSPQQSWQVTVDVRPSGDESTVHTHSRRANSNTEGRSRDPFILDETIETGNPEYDRVFEQARRDVCALTTLTERGHVPLAGAPWFVTVFGRDALLAAQFLLPVAPALARGTLNYLANWQGTAHNEQRDEDPGKIFHEVRQGELARTGAVPHRPYYGSIDATPLWIILLRDTWRWTGDESLVARHGRTFDAAIEYLQQAVDAVGDDPFLYFRNSGVVGVVHKEWRDSANGVQYRNGRKATPPLASAAVQGYLYGALTSASDLVSTVRGNEQRAKKLETTADELAARFDDAFWMADRQTYATALTPEGEQVDSVTSAVGHCLWSEIVPSVRVDPIVNTLLSSGMFSGWGLRTLAADDAAYSPVSYHAGGVWPHDNAIAALGLAAYDRHDAVERIVEAQLDAFVQMDANSAPELFCGFADSTPPEEYPSACRPQVWAAAAPFGFLRALFSLDARPSDAAPTSRQQCVVSEETLEMLLSNWGVG